MSSASDRHQLTLSVSPRDRLQGSLGAAIVLVEYGDYQCPRCGAAYPIIQQIQVQFGDRLCYVFRHFPQSHHTQAQKTAEAVEAAAAQGKFWQMHQILLARQQALSDADLVEYALELGLDVLHFLRDLANHTHARRVDEDKQSGIESGVRQTPTFFINAVRYDGNCTMEELATAIVQAGQSE